MFFPVFAAELAPISFRVFASAGFVPVLRLMLQPRRVRCSFGGGFGTSAALVQPAQRSSLFLCKGSRPFLCLAAYGKVVLFIGLVSTLAST